MADLGGKRELLLRGVIAARAGDKAEALRYLERALSCDLDYEDAVEAWIWMAEMVDDPAQKRQCLESALAINMSEPRARRKLAILDGRLAPEDVVNADTLRLAVDSGPALCAECGGPLFFDASGTERRCERCGWRPSAALLSEADPDTLLTQGIAAAKARRWQDAQRNLRAVTQHVAAGDEDRITAWLWLSGVVESASDKRACLEAVLRIDPKHPLAWRGLAHLETQSRAESTPVTGVGALLSGSRLTCKQCGAKLSYDADSKQLCCAYCGSVQLMDTPSRSGKAVPRQDFAVTLATAKGHTRPEGVRALKCGGCGAAFLPAPGVLSLTCSYCGSAHVTNLSEEALILPQAIAPFTIGETAAQQALEQWLRRNGYVTAPRAGLYGVYFPVWAFDVGGAIPWRCTLVKKQGRSVTMVSRSGTYYLNLDNVPVAASHTLPADLAEELDEYDLKQLQPYNPAFLADWPAEVYHVTMSDASLLARQQFRETIARQVRINPYSIVGESGRVQNMYFSTAQVSVDTYNLVLLPVWLASYNVEGTTYQVFINGQSGRVRGQEPPSLLRGFMKALFG